METERDQTPKEIKVWLEDLEQEQDRLNEWERGYVANIQEAYLAGNPVTTLQCRKLKEVYERYF